MQKKYQEFLESAAGDYMVKTLTKMIADEHRKSEKNPASARDNAQYARGIRAALNHFTVIATKSKGGK